MQLLNFKILFRHGNGRRNSYRGFNDYFKVWHDDCKDITVRVMKILFKNFLKIVSSRIYRVFRKFYTDKENLFKNRF